MDRFERFSLAIMEASRYWHKIASDEMEQYGLKGPHAMYLLTMERFQKGITAARLSDVCGKDKSDVSRAMSLMQKKGLVSRVDVNRTLYRSLLKLTPEGKNAALQLPVFLPWSLPFLFWTSLPQVSTLQGEMIFYHV